MYKFISTILFAIIVSSCTQNTTKKNDYHEINFANVINKEVKFSSILDSSYQLIPLETSDNIIGRVSKIHLTKNNIFILDAMSSKSLFVFDRTGNFNAKIGGVGKGPHEYTLPYDFFVDEENKQIQILDSDNRIIVYDYTGNYIKNIKLKTLNPSNLTKLKNGYAFIGGGHNDNLLLTNKEFEVINSYFPFINPEFNRAIINPFQNINDSLVTYRKFMNDTVYRIDNMQIKPHIVFNLGNNAYPMKFNGNPQKRVKKQARTKLYYETSKDCFSVILKNNIPYICAYSKATKNSIIIPYNKFDNDITYEKMSSYVIGTDRINDAYVFLVEPFNLLRALSKNPSLEETPNATKIIKLSKGITNTSNPILLIAKLKEMQ